MDKLIIVTDKPVKFTDTLIIVTDKPSELTDNVLISQTISISIKGIHDNESNNATLVIKAS